MYLNSFWFPLITLASENCRYVELLYLGLEKLIDYRFSIALFSVFSSLIGENSLLVYSKLASPAGVAGSGPSSVMTGFSISVQPATPASRTGLLCEQ